MWVFSQGHCNVNAIDKTKRTPLIMSVSQGHQHMMEMLIAAGKPIGHSLCIS